MTKFGLSVSLQIDLKVMPETLLIADVLAPCADGDQPPKGFDFVEGYLKSFKQGGLLLFRQFAFSYVADGRGDQQTVGGIQRTQANFDWKLAPCLHRPSNSFPWPIGRKRGAAA